MDISIITVSYNAESTIEKTIKSVLKQKKENIEYLIIDGNSNDNTMSIVNKYKEDIDMIISEKDNGLWDALNKGIKLSTGKYIMMISADDQLLPNALNVFLENVKKETQVWSGMVYMHCPYGYEYMRSDKDLQKLEYYCSLRHPATFFRREVYEQYGYYDTRYKCAGDRELFLRFYRNNVVFQVEDIPIVLFEGGGLSTADPRKVALPEDKAISLQYGMNKKEADEYYRVLQKKYKPSQVRDVMKKIAFQTHMFDLLCMILKKENKRVKKRELQKYHII